MWRHRKLSLLAGVWLALSAPDALAAAAVDTNNLGPVDVPLPAILAPMIVDSRLESYAYITISFKPASPAGILAIREKMAFLQDAVLRELNGPSIVKPDDPKSVDEAALKTRLMARVNRILPAGTVAELNFENVSIVPVQSTR